MLDKAQDSSSMAGLHLGPDVGSSERNCRCLTNKRQERDDISTIIQRPITITSSGVDKLLRRELYSENTARHHFQNAWQYVWRLPDALE